MLLGINEVSHRRRGARLLRSIDIIATSERNYIVYEKEHLIMKHTLASSVYLVGDGPTVVYTDLASLRTSVQITHLYQILAWSRYSYLRGITFPSSINHDNLIYQTMLSCAALFRTGCTSQLCDSHCCKGNFNYTVFNFS